jgi:3-deoxy-manno-octulosonate cytidylyltransferase (CMP-KDO synthetase)
MKLIEIFRKDATGQVDLASLMREIKDEEVINNPNNVKVVTDQNDFVFSRSVIPYPREQNVGVRYMQHIGIYAWKQALSDFYSLPMKSLEASENWNNCVTWNLGNELKWSKRRM